MLRIGLTGNIAVGKSCASARFAELGAAVIDADLVSRELMEPGAPVYFRVAEAFGPEILHDDGTIDRRRLGSVVFVSEEKRRLLESIVHPAIRDAIALKIAQIGEYEKTADIVIVDAALMIETGGYREYDRLIVVACQAALQLTRLMARDGLTESEAKVRITSQMPTNKKVRFADYVIDTSDSLESTREQVDAIYRKLRLYAKTWGG
jgi:dephospho-CoA kinase